MGVLSDRSNIIVIADEAHRSQYDFITGSRPISMRRSRMLLSLDLQALQLHSRDKILAEYSERICIYDLKQSILDRSTVNIYREDKRIPLATTKESKLIDEAFEAATEGEEVISKGLTPMDQT